MLWIKVNTQKALVRSACARVQTGSEILPEDLDLISVEKSYADNDPAIKGSAQILPSEPIAKPAYSVTPVKTGVQNTLKRLDSGFRRNDAEGLLQLALPSSR